MNNKIRKIKARSIWLQTYKTLGSVSKAARRCGIPRSTLYRWLGRYRELGLGGLQDKSQRPKKLGKLKVTPELEKLIIYLRQKYKFGPKRIAIQLIRNNDANLSVSTIWRILNKHNVPAIKKYRKHKDYLRYNRPIPSDSYSFSGTDFLLKADR